MLYESQDPTETFFDTFIRSVRVSPAGQILDNPPTQFPLDQFSPNTIGLNVSGQGGQWLVTRCVYHADGYGTYLAGQRIGGDGHLIDSTPVVLIDWVYGPLDTIASNGEYLVVGPDWNDSSIRRGRRIGLDLHPLAAAFSLPRVTLSIAGNGSEYYVTWIANFTDLVGSRMTQTGTLLTPAGTMLVPNFAGEVSMTHDGTNWWLASTVSDIAKTMRISPAGAVLDPGGIQLPIVIPGNVNSIYGPKLSPVNGGGIIYSWHDLRAALGNDTNVFALPVSPANTAGTERCLSTSVPNQRNPEVCAGPDGATAVVFVSELAHDARVLVHLLAANGDPVSTEPIEVYRGIGSGRAGVAFNGSLYLVAFDTSTGVKARRMNPDGSFVDAQPFDVLPGFSCAVGALGDDFLVVAARFFSFQTISLTGRRVDGPTGALLDPSPLILGGGYVTAASRVRTDGTRWFVTSHSMWTHDSSQGDAFCTTVPRTGPSIAGPNPLTNSGGSGDLDVAFSGTTALFVWRSNSLSNANNYISGRIMNADGTFTHASFVIAEAAGRQLRPTVCWNGSTFVVMWDDQRNQGSFFDARTDIYAARVSQSGTLLDTGAFPVLAGPNGECSPALLGRDGATLVASTRFLPAPQLDSYRIGVGVVFNSPCLSVAGPSDQAACPADTVALSVSPSGTGPFAFLWRKDGQPIDAIANPSALTSTLVLAAVQPVDAGSYDCAVSSICGSATSSAAILTVGGPACCPADFNHDGILNADDLADFITGYFNTPSDPRTDFNADGAINADDLGDFITAYFNGC